MLLTKTDHWILWSYTILVTSRKKDFLLWCPPLPAVFAFLSRDKANTKGWGVSNKVGNNDQWKEIYLCKFSQSFSFKTAQNVFCFALIFRLNRIGNVGTVNNLLKRGKYLFIIWIWKILFSILEFRMKEILIKHWGNWLACQVFS